MPEWQRKRLVHPLSNVRRWRASLNHGNGKGLKRDAMAAWRRFVSCAQALSSDQAMPLWQAVLAEVAIVYKGTRVNQSYDSHARCVHLPFLWMSAQIVHDDIDCLTKLSPFGHANKRGLLRPAHCHQSINHARDITGADSDD